jgi:hypothetical protein
MLNEELKRLLSANKISEAISIMTEILNGKDEEMSNALVLLSGRLTAGERSHLAGLIKFEEFQSLIISISNAALNYIDSATNDGYFVDIPDMKSLKEKRVEGKKTKLLFVGSLPKDLSLDFQIEKEYLEIRKVFNNVREKFEATEVFNTTLDMLFDTVRKEKPTILHIAAPATNECIVLHRKDNTQHHINWEFLASAFIAFQPDTKCVFINTWCSAIFLKKISTFLGCTIGCKDVVMDNDSITFSSGFYAALAQGKDYKQAFHFGKELLLEEKRNTVVPNSYGIVGAKSKEKQEDVPFKIPYVLFINGVADDPTDTTADDFPCETTSIKSKTKG